MICARCNRPILRPSLILGGVAYGPKCAQRVNGSGRHVQRGNADDRQGELFEEERGK